MVSLYCNTETVSGNVKFILQHRDSVGECYIYTATHRQCRGMLSLYCNTETVSGIVKFILQHRDETVSGNVKLILQHRDSVREC